MKRPYLIQRCELGGGKLTYDYMGSSEFEWGACPASLKRIFASGLTEAESTVVVGGKNVQVFLVAGADFAFSEYQQYLQQLADNSLRLKEWSNFDSAIKLSLGIPLDWKRDIRTNAWFDIDNDVLWTLSRKDQQALSAALSDIQVKWASKETAT